MSLTHFIQFKTPVRDRLAELFPKPRWNLAASLKVPPSSTNRALIGTAFDYLARFHLEKLYPFATTYPWTAQQALEQLGHYGETGVLFETFQGYVTSGQVHDRLRRSLREARARVQGFIAGDGLSSALIRSTLKLAYADLLFRSHRYDPQFGRTTRGQEEELRTLIQAVDWSQWPAHGCCLLNPHFGAGSIWIGGADADVLLDDTLIDLKTTATLQVTAKDWRQILGYAALNTHFPIGDGAPRPIRHVGFYFARYGHLITRSLHEVVDPASFERFSLWLRDFLADRERERQTQKIQWARERTQEIDRLQTRRRRAARKAARTRRRKGA